MTYKTFGYNCFGPLLLGFSKWLFENIKKEGIHKVYFFSRDGFIMKQAFEKVCSDPDIKLCYLEVSRRSLRVPILWKDFSLENLFTMLTPSMMIPLTAVFDAVGLNINHYSSLIKKYGFEEESSISRSNFLSDLRIRHLYSELSNEILNNSKCEYENLSSYIKQNNIGGKFAIVDIGWSGGMQRFLQETLDEMEIPNEIYGYYTGVANYYKRNVFSNKILRLKGYLFDFCNDKNAYDPRGCFVGLYELMFLEKKGSVKKYIKDINSASISVLRYPYEFDSTPELKVDINNINIIQENALLYVDDNKHRLTSNIPPFELCANLLKFGMKPNNKEIELFGHFPFYDEGVITYLCNPHSFFYYMFHPYVFKNDFIGSRWKTAFLKKVFILPLPYDKIYDVLCKLKK